MTDDELERALGALPLEEPPPDLHGRILAATVYRPRLTFRTWEIWAIGTVSALAVWLAVSVFAGVPDAGSRVAQALTAGVTRIGEVLATTTMLWAALGVTSALWASQLSLPQQRRRAVDR